MFPNLRQCPYVESHGPVGGNEDKIARSIAADVHLHRYGQCIPTLDDPNRSLCPWKDRDRLADEIRHFIDAGGKEPELWAWCASYDFVVLCQIFGGMLSLPEGWPHYVRDFQQILDDRGVTDDELDELPIQQGRLHNALDDAVHLKKLWNYIIMDDELD